MPYLTRIYLNPLRAGARKLLRSPQAMHGAVAATTALYDEPGRSLWRLDTDNPHRPALYLLTQHQPDATHIVEQAGWPATDAGIPETRDYTPLLDRIAKDDVFAFRLTASPTYSRTPERKPDNPDGSPQLTRGKIAAHTTPAQQTAWLVDKCARWGFAIPRTGADGQPDMRITRRDRTDFTKNTGGGTITIISARYEGLLTVTDPTAFRTALTLGMGRSRAYGCGLLTLASPDQPITPHTQG